MYEITIFMYIGKINQKIGLGKGCSYSDIINLFNSLKILNKKFIMTSSKKYLIFYNNKCYKFHFFSLST